MKERKHRRTLILCLTTILCLGLTGCTEGKKGMGKKSEGNAVQGIWSGTAQDTGSPNPTFTVNLNTEDEGEIGGSISSLDGTFDEAALSGVGLVDQTLSFSATANGSNARRGKTYSFQARIQGEKMEGTWKEIGATTWGSFTVNRKPAPE